MAEFDARFGKVSRSAFNADRALRRDEDRLDSDLARGAARDEGVDGAARPGDLHVLRYDREPCADSPILDIFEYPEVRIEIRVNGRALAFRQYDRFSEIDHIVDNKRLGHVLQVAQIAQATRDDRNNNQPARLVIRQQSSKRLAAIDGIKEQLFGANAPFVRTSRADLIFWKPMKTRTVPRDDDYITHNHRRRKVTTSRFRTPSAPQLTKPFILRFARHN
ncbi:hypothetical protein QCE63_16645 [Caballeronia sp. LZ065]|uniref:hypothetical protein n=1 Tax=Caballeronia sp. LZ065 TaxID=3038571 RepID=UPI00286725B1|nr:hypothetical protein [Caballeronia sp. LZ065]MDR5781053.1 hypothetical protein [Caballeronia sp. LZ065]